MPRTVRVSLMSVCLVAACAAPPTSPNPSVAGTPSPSVVPSRAEPTPKPTAEPTDALSLPPPPVTVAFPIRGSARELAMHLQISPGPDGTVFAAIPRPGGSEILLLGPDGRPRQGWPIAIAGSSSCELVLPVADGTLRVVCAFESPDGTGPALAFDRDGTLLPGWPMALKSSIAAASVVGDELRLLADWRLKDPDDGTPVNAYGLVTVAADGSSSTGVPVPMYCCEGGAAIAPDGIAYGVGSDLPSQIFAIDASGMGADWPLDVQGIVSGPAIVSGGAAMVVGSPSKRTSEVMIVDARSGSDPERSGVLPIVTVTESWGEVGGCSAYRPQTPVAAQNGSIFVFSEEDGDVLALDSTLHVMDGWPYKPSTPLVRRDERYVKEDAYCPITARPAAAPDGTLYLPLQARSSTGGGSLVAVGPDATMRPGWPQELSRAGAEFWSVAVGADGTVYALAVEPESARTSSASLLAMAPDSTVLWATTIIEP
jgi:hypothetical protein